MRSLNLFVYDNWDISGWDISGDLPSPSFVCYVPIRGTISKNGERREVIVDLSWNCEISWLSCILFFVFTIGFGLIVLLIMLSMAKKEVQRRINEASRSLEHNLS